jgi:hypothetical protein
VELACQTRNGVQVLAEWSSQRGSTQSTTMGTLYCKSTSQVNGHQSTGSEVLAFGVRSTGGRLDAVLEQRS